MATATLYITALPDRVIKHHLPKSDKSVGSGWLNKAGGTTNLWEEANEQVDSADDATTYFRIAPPNGISSELQLNLQTPTDLSVPTGYRGYHLSVKYRYAAVGRVDDSLTTYCHIIEGDGTTQMGFCDVTTQLTSFETQGADGHVFIFPADPLGWGQSDIGNFFVTIYTQRSNSMSSDPITHEFTAVEAVMQWSSSPDDSYWAWAVGDPILIDGNYNYPRAVSAGITNMPSDFSAVTGLSFTLSALWTVNPSPYTLTVYACVIDPNDWTILAGSTSGTLSTVRGSTDGWEALSDVLTNVSQPHSVTFTYVNGTATKTQWDRAVVAMSLRLSGGISGMAQFITNSATSFTLTYTAAAPSPPSSNPSNRFLHNLVR